jgi:RNA polymerase-binding transcription factor DksA
MGGVFLSSLTGTQVLTREDLAPAMEALQQLLIGKNVAREAAATLCESVASSLEGQRLEVAGSIAATVAGALRGAIERIEHNRFGRCEYCLDPIAPERLLAIPYTRVCARCAP